MEGAGSARCYSGGTTTPRRSTRARALRTRSVNESQVSPDVSHSICANSSIQGRRVSGVRQGVPEAPRWSTPPTCYPDRAPVACSPAVPLPDGFPQLRRRRWMRAPLMPRTADRPSPLLTRLPTVSNKWCGYRRSPGVVEISQFGRQSRCGSSDYACDRSMSGTPAQLAKSMARPIPTLTTCCSRVEQLPRRSG